MNGIGLEPHPEGMRGTTKIGDIHIGCHQTDIGWGDWSPAYIIVGQTTDDYHYGINDDTYGRILWGGLPARIEQLLDTVDTADQFIAAIEAGHLDHRDDD